MKQKGLCKRFLAVSLTLIMVLGLMPMTVMAEGGESPTAVPSEGQTFEVPAVPTRDEEWEWLRDVIGAHYGSWDDVTTAYRRAVTQQMPNSGLMGNADLGVSSDGTPDEKIFRIAKSDHWRVQPSPGAWQEQVGSIHIQSTQEETDDLVLSNFRAGRLTVTSTNHHSAFPPYRAVNGSVTAGSGAEGWVSTHYDYDPVPNHWVQLEFAEPITFNHWIYYAEAWSRPLYPSRTPRSFDVQTSDDGVLWTTLPNSAIIGNDEHIVSVTLDDPITTRFVRIWFEQPEQTDDINRRARMSRFELFAPVTNPNLALGATSAHATSSHGAFPPIRAVNGTVTEGSGAEGWVSGPAGYDGIALDARQALVIRFADAITFIRYHVMADRWSRLGEGPGNTFRSFDVQVCHSPDGAWNSGRTWITVDEVRDNPGANAHVDRTLANAAEDVYWVRLYFHQPTQAAPMTGNVASGTRARVARFELYEFLDDPSNGGIEPDVPHYEKIQNILYSQLDVEKSLGGMPLRMETITPANDNLIITRLTSLAEPMAQPMPMSVETRASAGAYGATYNPRTEAAFANHVTVTRTTRAPGIGGINSGYVLWRSQVAVSTRIIGASVMTRTAGIGAAALDFDLAPGQTVYIVTAVGGGGQTFRSTENPNIHIPGELPNLVRNPEINIWPAEEAEQLLNTVMFPIDIENLWEDHRSWWRDYWQESWVWMDTSGPNLAPGQWGDGPLRSQTEWLMRYYYGAQHILGMASREGFTAPGLYGHWVTHSHPFWNNDYHMNYNFQATFYGMFSSNRRHQARPAIEAVLAYEATGRRIAEDTEMLRRVATHHDAARPPLSGLPLPAYGQGIGVHYVDYRINRDFDHPLGLGVIHPTDGIPGGLMVPVAIGPWGTTIGTPGFHNQTLCGPFAAYLLIEYFKYAPNVDTEFLARLYSFVEGVAIFGMHWVEPQAEGYYRWMAAYNEGSWAKNAGAELALYRHLFEYAALMHEALAARPDVLNYRSPMDETLPEKWRHVLNNLPPAPRGHFAAGDISGEVLLLAERRFDIRSTAPHTQAYAIANSVWQDRPDPRTPDRNILQLESLNPTRVLGLFSPEDYREIAHRTISLYGVGNAGWNANNNFAKIYPMSVRIAYPIDTIVNQFSRVISERMANNLRIVDPFHGVEKAGSTLAINDMMLQGHLGVVQVFPHWLPNVDASFGRLRAPGGFVVSASYDGDTQSIDYPVQVLSTAGVPMTIVHPWQSSTYNSIAVINSAGERIPITKGTAPNWDSIDTFTFATVENETYWIFPYFDDMAVELTVDEYGEITLTVPDEEAWEIEVDEEHGTLVVTPPADWEYDDEGNQIRLPNDEWSYEYDEDNGIIVLIPPPGYEIVVQEDGTLWLVEIEIAPFVPVTGITGVPTTTVAGTPLPLVSTVAPSNATNSTIVWSIANAGTTGATLVNGVLTAQSAGTVTVTATILDGTAVGTPFVRTFTIAVTAQPVEPVETATVRFYRNDGTGRYLTPIEVDVGRTITPPVDPVKEGYEFVGWYLNYGTPNQVRKNFANPITGDVRLVAVWQQAAPESETHTWFMMGRAGGNFVPSGNITRAEVATMLVRTMIPEYDPALPPPTGMPFPDVAPDAWFFGYVSWAYDAGFIEGRPDGRFDPRAHISRQEVAAMVARATGVDILPAGEFSIVDADRISTWAQDYVYTVYRQGWMVGNMRNQLQPRRFITRAETATVFFRVLERGVTNADSLELVADDLRIFPDVASSRWYYYYVIEASHTHEFIMEDGVEIWTSVTVPGS